MKVFLIFIVWKCILSLRKNVIWEDLQRSTNFFYQAKILKCIFVTWSVSIVASILCRNMQITHVIKNNSQYHFNVCMKFNVKLSENTKNEILIRFIRFTRRLIIWVSNMLVKIFLNHCFCEFRNRSLRISFFLNNVLRLNSVMLMKNKWERLVNEFRIDFFVYLDIVIKFSDNKAQIVYFTYFRCHDYWMML